MLIFALLFAMADAPATDTPAPPPPESKLVFERILPSLWPQSLRYAPVGPYYPEIAARMGVTGEAVLECHTKERGELSDCTVISETPAGYYFGAASLRMAKGRWMRAEKTTPPGELVRVRVPFTIAKRQR